MCIDVLVEAILRLQGTVQGLPPVKMASVSGTKSLFTVARLLHGMGMVQQVIIGVEMVVIAVCLLLRVVFGLAPSGGWRSRGVSIDHLFTLVSVHLITEVCGKIKLHEICILSNKLNFTIKEI